MAEAPIEEKVGNSNHYPEENTPPGMTPEPKIKEDVQKHQYTGSPILLHDRYYIDPSAPIPKLDAPSSKAYSVRDSVHSNRSLFSHSQCLFHASLPPLASSFSG